jgi:hypothetical protein
MEITVRMEVGINQIVIVLRQRALERHTPSLSETPWCWL